MMDEKALEREISSMHKGSVVLVEADPEYLFPVVRIAAGAMSAKGKCVLVSSSRPFQSLSGSWGGAFPETLFVIDCVSGKSGRENSVSYVDGASNLTTISIEMAKAASAGASSVLVDSITSLLIYNKQEVLVRFIHSALTKIRISGTSCVLLAAEGLTVKDARAEIVQLCDKVIRVQDKV